MKQKRMLLCFFTILLICCKKEEALVSVLTHLSVRESPNKNSPVIKKLYNNEKIFIIEETNKFEFVDDVYGQYVKIEDSTGTKGYVFDAFLVPEKFAVKFRDKNICLVLSVGGSNGIAHLGALKAINYLNLSPNCVYGNSMGAFVGSLYAKYPRGDHQNIYSNLMELYIKRMTQMKYEAAESNGLLGGLALAFINPFLGIAGGMLIADNSARSIDEKNLDNFESFLDNYFNQSLIEDLPIKYATSHFQKNGQGVDLIINKRGNLAHAISGSISNPYIFSLNNNSRIDPGIDRSASTPISDACSTFKSDIIIGINVSGKKAIYEESLSCKVLVIDLNYQIPNDSEIILGKGNEYETLIKKAFSESLYKIKEESKKLK
ncbi:esterase [Leptospira biflexa]|uniref:patatin-like phospholipase family protein n=1 Tax=Leptospira biflexa TaxID=172 RepID=UPI00109123E6|nr:patatin-like phospholipase family protein [Leptospira biflexa]TGM42624.1 esterase [Leptospira biflexa]TGM45702.1 esterase [Leptospira biflexa]